MKKLTSIYLVLLCLVSSVLEQKAFLYQYFVSFCCIVFHFVQALKFVYPFDSYLGCFHFGLLWILACRSLG